MQGRFRDSKTYDVLAALPLAAFYALGAVGLVPQVVTAVRAAAANPAGILNAVSLLLVLGFIALQAVLFVIRRPPLLHAPNWLARLAALAGSNCGLAFLLLPRIAMGPTAQAVSAALIAVGSAASIYCAATLGRAFSVFPQARRLTMAGPYRYVRHPLYLAEMIATLGVMLQFRQPWASGIALAAIALQFPRMHFEERLLSEAYPDYRGYQARTARLIPGIY